MATLHVFVVRYWITDQFPGASGHAQSYLTDVGLKQAEAIAERLLPSTSMQLFSDLTVPWILQERRLTPQSAVSPMPVARADCGRLGRAHDGELRCYPDNSYTVDDRAVGVAPTGESVTAGAWVLLRICGYARRNRSLSWGTAAQCAPCYAWRCTCRRAIPAGSALTPHRSLSSTFSPLAVS